LSHRKRNQDGYILPKYGASARTIKRWDARHDYSKPEDAGFKKLSNLHESTDDMAVSSFKPMKKVEL